MGNYNVSFIIFIIIYNMLGFFYFYRYFFHCLRKYSEEKRFLCQKLSINEIDFNIVKLKNFFPDITNKDLFKIAFREILFLNHKSWALFTFLFTICYYFSSPFF